MQMGDAGAEVIKVERPQGDWCRSLGPSIEGESALYLALNRNKKSIVVDINKEAGKEIVRRLAKEADVLVESFGTNLGYKFGYEEMRRIKPNIIYASISPFGETGPYRNRVASELEIQGMSGYMSFLGEPGEEPVRVGADVAATNSGMLAFIGILAALYYRRKTGYGQKVEVSMLRGLIAASQFWIGAQSNPDTYSGWFLTGQFDHAETGYRTKDVPITFGLITGRLEQGRRSFEEFCKKVGLETMLSDPYFSEHGARMLGIGRDAQEMKPIYENAFADKSAEEIVRMIDEVGGMAAPLYTYDMLFGDPPHPQVVATDTIQEIEHPVAGRIRVTGLPWTLEKTPVQIMAPAPTLGQDTAEILTSLGYAKEATAALKKEKVVT